MLDSSRFPVIVGPPKPENKAEELAKAIGKTIASVEFGREQLSSGGHQAEAMILYFTDGSSMAIVTGYNANDHVDNTLTKAKDAETALGIVWKAGDKSEREAFDDVMGMWFPQADPLTPPYELQRKAPIPGYGTLYVGEIGKIETKRIGSDPRRIPAAKKAGAGVVGGGCNHYLELFEQEQKYEGVLRVGERDPPPLLDRSQHPYSLDTEGQVVRSGQGETRAGGVVGREVAVDGKLVEVRDDRGPHQVLLIGVVSGK